MADIFWWAAEWVQFFAHLVAPFLLLATAVVWISRERSSASLAALIGGFLFFGAELVRYVFPAVYGVAFNYRQPATDQNGVVYFFYIHGWWLGMAIFGFAILVHFVRWRNHAPQER